MSSVEALSMFSVDLLVPHMKLDWLPIFLTGQKKLSVKKFEEVSHCVYNMYVDIIKSRHLEFTIVHPIVQAQFSLHLHNCIGAIDATHILFVVPSKKVLQHIWCHGYRTVTPKF